MTTVYFIKGLVHRIPKLVMVRHCFGYDDCYSSMYNEKFDFYQRIGCRHRAACLTPCHKKDGPIAYYRDYSEPSETRLYFKGFSLQQLRKYASSFFDQSECSKCSLTSVRPIVKCQWP